MDGEQGGRYVCNGENANFVWSIGAKEKTSSSGVHSTASAVHSNLPSQIAID
jgi:hypothetical protein